MYDYLNQPIHEDYFDVYNYSYPERIYLTVTGSINKNVEWLGEKWNLPEESGIVKEVKRSFTSISLYMDDMGMGLYNSNLWEIRRKTINANSCSYTNDMGVVFSWTNRKIEDYISLI